MKNYLIPVFLFYWTTLFAQEHHSDTSLVINKQNFKIQVRDINSDRATLTIYRNRKIVMLDTVDANGFSNLKFFDFDKDGNTDIMLTYMGNNFAYDLYLFDKIEDVFRFVKGFDRFPESQQLKTNPKYYFSYNRAGCSDMNWESDLFLIADFKTIQIGKMYGNGCDFDIERYPQVIEVYKIINNAESKNKLITKLQYLKHIPAFGDKWDFIKKYWEKNYLKVTPAKTTNR